VPEQAPDQPANCQPEAGAAVKATEVPEEYVSEQSLPQLMPVPVTVPEPVLETLKAYVTYPHWPETEEQLL
jgi:hypothetical protein